MSMNPVTRRLIPMHLPGPPIYGSSSEDEAGVSGFGGAAQPGVYGAAGEKGTAVVADGHNPGEVGIHALGGPVAGHFQGNVEITGTLSGPSVDHLLSAIAQLADRVADLEASRMKRFGVAVSPVQVQPSLVVTATASGGHFTVTGDQYAAGAKIVLRIINVTKNTSVDGIGRVPGTVPAAELYFSTGDIDTAFRYSDITSNSDKTLNKNINLNCGLGDSLLFCATDGRADTTDSTGWLWSAEVLVTAL